MLDREYWLLVARWAVKAMELHTRYMKSGPFTQEGAERVAASFATRPDVARISLDVAHG